MRKPTIIAATASLVMTASLLAAETVVVDFESGAEGWIGPAGGGGATALDPANGNPGANLHTIFNDFGITFRNSTNPDFVQDYSQFDTVTFAIDVKVEDISFIGSPVTRPWLLEIRDYDNVPAGYPWVSVWYLFDWVGAGEWTNWSVTIVDPGAADLPAGWGGYGAEDPETFEPILPANRTFTDVLAGADEIVYSTLQPGFFFGFTDFDVRIDNITVETEGGVEPVPGDVDGDGLVNSVDLLQLLAEWGTCGGCAGDFDGDGRVTTTDLLFLLANWTV